MNPQLPPTLPSESTEPYSMVILVIVVIALMVVIVLPELSSWWRRRQVQAGPDNVIRKNVKRRCRQCGRPVMTDAFDINPTCIVCRDLERGME